MTLKYYTLQMIVEIVPNTSIEFWKEQIKNGMIKATKISKNYLISEYELLKFLEQMEVKLND